MKHQEIVEKYHKHLKEYATDESGDLKTKKLVRTAVTRAFPELGEYFVQNFPDNLDEWRKFMYIILNNLYDVPVCPICGNPVKLENYVKGFGTTCSKECQGKWFSRQTDIHKRMSETKKNNGGCNIPGLEGYITYTENNGNYVVIKDYCKHGDLRISRPALNTLLNSTDLGQPSCLCPECSKEIYENFTLTQEEYDTYINETFPEYVTELYSKRDGTNYKESVWITRKPREFRILTDYYSKHIETYKDKSQLPELYHVVLNRITERPRCVCPDCNEYVSFVNTARSYNKFCDRHGRSYNRSAGEYEIENFLRLNYPDVRYSISERNILSDGKEFDFYFPDTNTALEYNGGFFHSTKVNRSATAHLDKKNDALSKGVRLYFLWDDDWKERRAVCEDMIRRIIRLDIVEVPDTIITHKPVSPVIVEQFISDNTLYRLSQPIDRCMGLYTDDGLVAVMPVRDNPDGSYTILCYTEKLGHIVPSGPERLFRALDIPEGSTVYYDVDEDLSSDLIPRSLGMEFVSHTNPPKYYYKGSRYDTSAGADNPKYLFTCYGAGVSRYVGVKGSGVCPDTQAQNVLSMVYGDLDFNTFTRMASHIKGTGSISEKLYCLRHSFNEPPKCPFCNRYRRFYNNVVGYEPTCGNLVCQSDYTNNIAYKKPKEKVKIGHIEQLRDKIRKLLNEKGFDIEEIYKDDEYRLTYKLKCLRCGDIIDIPSVYLRNKINTEGDLKFCNNCDGFIYKTYQSNKRERLPHILNQIQNEGRILWKNDLMKPHIRKEIVTLLPWLNITDSWNSRAVLWHLLNKNYDEPKCPDCGRRQKFVKGDTPTSGHYTDTCDCHRTLQGRGKNMHHNRKP